MTTSKSIDPPLMVSARSSKPTMSAPAAVALSAFSPCAKTATRTVLPVPFGKTVEPRTTWSDLRGSTPRLTETSILSANFAVASSLTRPRASPTSYAFCGSILSQATCFFLLSFGITSPPQLQCPYSVPFRRRCVQQRPYRQPSGPASWSWRYLRAAHD